MTIYGIIVPHFCICIDANRSTVQTNAKKTNIEQEWNSVSVLSCVILCSILCDCANAYLAIHRGLAIVSSCWTDCAIIVKNAFWTVNSLTFSSNSVYLSSSVLYISCWCCSFCVASVLSALRLSWSSLFFADVCCTVVLRVAHSSSRSCNWSFFLFRSVSNCCCCDSKYFEWCNSVSFCRNVTSSCSTTVVSLLERHVVSWFA